MENFVFRPHKKNDMFWSLKKFQYVILVFIRLKIVYLYLNF